MRSREDDERQLQVHVGDVETVDGGRQVFGAVARVATEITALIQRALKTWAGSSLTEIASRCLQ